MTRLAWTTARREPFRPGDRVSFRLHDAAPTDPASTGTVYFRLRNGRWVVWVNGSHVAVVDTVSEPKEMT